MTMLDTDVFSLLERNAEPFAARVAAAGPLVISIITRIERLQGRFEAILKVDSATNLLARQNWLALTELLIAGFEVVPFDAVAAGHFTRLVGLKGMGAVGRADLLIACVALAHDAPLVTRNVRDFQRVPGLKLESW